ncbi:MAG: TIGR01777 family oxidoreductase, partial [Desulfobacterales bacterium]
MGFVGRPLCQRLIDQGHRVTAIGSRPREDVIAHPDFSYLAADTTRTGSWQGELNTADAVVNLTGRSIFKRWTKAYKQEIYESRILTTQTLVAGLNAARNPVFLSTSAIGYYGDTGEATVTESQGAGDDFLARLSIDWEAAALKAQDQGARVVLMRFGVVLGPQGGALEKMMPIFRLGGGGPLGSGRQWFSWIHLQDLVAAAYFLLTREEARGAYNFTAPQPVRNRELAATLGKTLHRPAFIPVPA